MSIALRSYPCVAALIGVSMLTACSSSSPSASDAEQAITQLLGDCRHVEVVNFEKLNGVPAGDNYYTVQLKYGLRFAPIEANSKIISDVKAGLEKIESMNQQAIQDYNSFRAKLDPVLAAGGDTAALYAQYPEEFARYQQAEVVKMNYPITKNSLTNQGQRLLMSNLLSECPGLPQQLAKDYAKTSMAALEDGVQVDYSNNLSMVKSDNGWIAQ